MGLARGAQTRVVHRQEGAQKHTAGKTKGHRLLRTVELRTDTRCGGHLCRDEWSNMGRVVAQDTHSEDGACVHEETESSLLLFNCFTNEKNIFGILAGELREAGRI
jgi:hypothetical protein